MIHYGDITKIRGYDVPIPDVVIGGSPCQDLSIAGKREGLDGERSGLFMEQIRIIKELRETDVRRNGRTGEFIRPRFMVWENVPGAFSSNKGEDFRIVLEETAKIIDKDASIPMPPKNKWTTSGAIVGDGWSIAWRILDAQFWGVPQRRRRLALVADFGGGCAQEILFVKDRLRGNTSESRTERQTASSDAQGSIGADDREGAITFEPGIASREGGHIYKGVSGTLRANAGDNQMSVAYGTHIYDIGDRRSVVNESVDVSPTLLSKMGTGGNNVPVVALDRASYNQGINAMFDIGIDENGIAFSHIAKGPGAVAYIDTTHADDVVRMDDVVAPLQARDYKGGKLIYCVDQGGGKSQANVTEGISPTLTCTHGGEPVICVQGNIVDRGESVKGNGNGWKEGTSYTLNTIDRPAVAYGFYPQMKAESVTFTEDKACCIVNGTNPGFHNGVVVTKPHYIVRRLTPLECERLQGFPDLWTDIGEYTDSKGKRKKTSDSARYKALGNSIALPPWKWVLKRLCSHYERDATMASLFDGIGGFPYLWEQLNGKGSCLWASEIEDFPIAVTKKRID